MENPEIKLTAPDDCGNAPKKVVLKNFMHAFAKKDTAFISEYLQDHINWRIVGVRTVQGKTSVVDMVKADNVHRVVELNIIQIITHGKTASANGIIKLADNRVFEFCNVFMFTSAGRNTIKEITTYIIET